MKTSTLCRSASTELDISLQGDADFIKNTIISQVVRTVNSLLKASSLDYALTDPVRLLKALRWLEQEADSATLPLTTE